MYRMSTVLTACHLSQKQLAYHRRNIKKLQLWETSFGLETFYSNRFIHGFFFSRLAFLDQLVLSFFAQYRYCIGGTLFIYLFKFAVVKASQDTETVV